MAARDRLAPNIVDLDGDGKNEVVGIPNLELHEPYETQSFAVMVLEGAQEDGTLLHDLPLPNPGHNGNGSGAPAPRAVADLDGDG